MNAFVHDAARHRMYLHAVNAAWKIGEIAAVEEALNAWRKSADELPTEYWLQRVSADSQFERPSLVESVARAERAARASGDDVSLARIASFIIDALYSDWLPIRGSRQWLDIVRDVAFARLCAVALPYRLEIATGILAADLYGEALSSASQVAQSIPQWVQESSELSPSIASNALGYSLEYFSIQRQWPAAKRVVAEIDRVCAGNGLGAVARARLASRRGFCFDYRRGDYSEALSQSNEAIRQARIAGVERAGREASITVTLCHLMRGELPDAEQALAAEAQGMPEGHLMMRANIHYERAWLHALRRDVVRAQLELDTACRLFAEIDEHGVMSLATPSLQAQLLVQVAEFDAALRVFEMRVKRPDAWIVDIGLIHALRALGSDDRSRAVDYLRQALPIAARIDIKGCLWACRDEFSNLLRLAAEQNIEPEWTRATALARRIAI